MPVFKANTDIKEATEHKICFYLAHKKYAQYQENHR